MYFILRLVPYSFDLTSNRLYFSRSSILSQSRPIFKQRTDAIPDYQEKERREKSPDLQVGTWSRSIGSSLLGMDEIEKEQVQGY